MSAKERDEAIRSAVLEVRHAITGLIGEKICSSRPGLDIEYTSYEWQYERDLEEALIKLVYAARGTRVPEVEPRDPRDWELHVRRGEGELSASLFEKEVGGGSEESSGSGKRGCGAGHAGSGGKRKSRKKGH